MRGKALALLLLLGFACSIAPTCRAETVEDDDEYEDVDAGAFVVVRRKLATPELQVGKVTTVTVEVHNAGKSDAKDVYVAEAGWAEAVFRTEGETSAKYDILPAGTTQSFSYSLTAKDAPGAHNTPFTVVTYVGESGSVTSKASPTVIYVLTPAMALVRKALGVGSTLTFGTLSSARDWAVFGGVLGVAGAAYVAYNAQKALAKTRADSRRRKALKDLGVDKLE